LGVIKDLTLSNGGLPEVWVSWYGKVEIPEQPLRLISEPILEHHLRIGDVVRFKGQQGEISEFLGDGRVKTREGVIIDFNQDEVVKKRTNIPRYGENPFHEWDIVEIIVKGNPDLRGRGGQWGIISEVFEFSVMVKVWDGTIQVRTENLRDLVLPTDQRESVKAIAARCHRLIEVEGINDMAKAALATLGKKKWLDEVEDGILGCIEGIYLGKTR
jgi:hypothetical protein